MTQQRLATGLAAVGALFALTALLFLSFWEGFYGDATIIERNGLGILSLLATPVALAVVGLLTMQGHGTAVRIARWAVAVVLLLFSLATVFSIGLFFLPAAVLLLFATLAAPGRRA